MKLRKIRTLLSIHVLLGIFVGIASGQSIFANPIIAQTSADPSVIYVGSSYYSVQAGCNHATVPVICIRQATTLPGLNGAAPVQVWTAPPCNGTSVPNCADDWAPQIAYFNSQWYIYYAADSTPGNNLHRLFALVPQSQTNPLGPWMAAATGDPSGAGELITDWLSPWGIDPDVFQASDGKYYLVYSCRQTSSGDGNGSGVQAQSICLSAMSDPLTLLQDPTSGYKVMELSYPSQSWETRGGDLATQEGPFGFTNTDKNGVKTDYILYSASFSGAADYYNMGLLINSHPVQASGGNPLTNPAAWVKQGPFFDGHDLTYGTASVVLVPSPDGTQLWNVYHGTDCNSDCTNLIQPGNYVWNDRSVRAQQAGWSSNGSLVLGFPYDIINDDGTGISVSQFYPSSTGTPEGVLATIPAWGASMGDAAENTNGPAASAYGQPSGIWSYSQSIPSSINLTTEDGSAFDHDFFYSNPNFQNYIVYTNVTTTSHGAPGNYPKYGVYAAYVDHLNYFEALIDTTVCDGGCVTTAGISSSSSSRVTSPTFLNCPLPANFVMGGTNSLAIEVTNNTFIVLVNGTPVSGPCQNRQFNLTGSQNAANGTNGQTGVVAVDTLAQYTNFAVAPGVPQSGITYALRNVGSGMNLDNACDGGCGGSVTQGTKVIQYPASAPYPLSISQTQVFSLSGSTDGPFTIISKMSGLCLDDPYGNSIPSQNPPTQGGTLLWQISCNQMTLQNWQFIPVINRNGNISFLIQNQSSGLFMDAQNTTTGTQVYLDYKAGASGSSTQQWQLLPQ
jgi:GH43 family beta-xylosidase